MPAQQMVKLEIVDKKELIPGAMLYKTPREQSLEVLEEVKRVTQDFWKPAGVYAGLNKSTINTEVRTCFNYFLVNKTQECGEQDPTVILYHTFENCFKTVVDDMQMHYDFINLTSDPINLLRYEVGGMFKKHLDDSWGTPRTASLSMILNDDFEGGDFEFNRFNLRVKAQAGDIIAFCAAFPYQHEVHTVTKGTRYSAVKWYRFNRT